MYNDNLMYCSRAVDQKFKIQLYARKMQQIGWKYDSLVQEWTIQSSLIRLNNVYNHSLVLLDDFRIRGRNCPFLV